MAYVIPYSILKRKYGMEKQSLDLNRTSMRNQSAKRDGQANNAVAGLPRTQA